jgi:hypothetical protein
LVNNKPQTRATTKQGKSKKAIQSIGYLLFTVSFGLKNQKKRSKYFTKMGCCGSSRITAPPLVTAIRPSKQFLGNALVATQPIAKGTYLDFTGHDQLLCAMNDANFRFPSDLTDHKEVLKSLRSYNVCDPLCSVKFVHDDEVRGVTTRDVAPGDELTKQYYLCKWMKFLADDVHVLCTTEQQRQAAFEVLKLCVSGSPVLSTCECHWIRAFHATCTMPHVACDHH